MLTETLFFLISFGGKLLTGVPLQVFPRGQLWENVTPSSLLPLCGLFNEMAVASQILSSLLAARVIQAWLKKTIVLGFVLDFSLQL